MILFSIRSTDLRRFSVMAISLSPDNLEAWSIAADHFVCRYRLFDSEETKVRLHPATIDQELISIEEYPAHGAFRDYCTWSGCYRDT